MSSTQLEKILGAFFFLQELSGFEIVKKEEPSFGNILAVIKVSHLIFRFTLDRDEWSVDVSSELDSEEWFDLSMIKALTNQDPIEGEYLNKADYNSLAKFLEENLSKVQQYFAPKNYLETKRNLNKLEDERAKKMFGNY